MNDQYAGGVTADQTPPDQINPETETTEDHRPKIKFCIEPLGGKRYLVYKETKEDDTTEEAVGNGGQGPMSPGQVGAEEMKPEFQGLNAATKEFLRLVETNPVDGGEEEGFQAGHKAALPEGAM